MFPNYPTIVETSPTDFRAKITVGESTETTGTVKVRAVSATVDDVAKVFEQETATFGVTINGPNKPISVDLVHKG